MEKAILAPENIRLNVRVKDKDEAILMVGKILIENGYVRENYISAMFEREKTLNTYVGNFVAIPHGAEVSKASIMHSGIAVLQIPSGVDYGGGNTAKLVFGIAGKNNEHLDLLAKIAIPCSELKNVEKMVKAKTIEELTACFA